MPIDNYLAFLCGLGGSLAVEVVLALQYFSNPPFPKRYRDWKFYVLRLVLALIGGGLAAA